MPVVQITMLEGRSEEQKRELAKAITKALVDTCGAKPESVIMTVLDVSTENIALGGELISDLRRKSS
ncbi:4-oxalocrotonate tautomerase [Heliorestis acidaminivorans]|uniref:Tautomerase n=1 Tax=Heliorestis acidaminivorans TaxID=553427 RepID=A0A6I0F6H9_9FIRM|nr:2-hydroxymuconate tautomerase [Heliorestis acidaminivorans]KAB2954437.1 4-oxalocrotonate tautomerase [Heliorestis acidaminivorans]